MIWCLGAMLIERWRYHHNTVRPHSSLGSSLLVVLWFWPAAAVRQSTALNDAYNRYNELNVRFWLLADMRPRPVRGLLSVLKRTFLAFD